MVVNLGYQFLSPFLQIPAYIVFFSEVTCEFKGGTISSFTCSIRCHHVIFSKVTIIKSNRISRSLSTPVLVSLSNSHAWCNRISGGGPRRKFSFVKKVLLRHSLRYNLLPEIKSSRVWCHQTRLIRAFGARTRKGWGRRRDGGTHRVPDDGKISNNKHI